MDGVSDLIPELWLRQNLFTADTALPEPGHRLAGIFHSRLDLNTGSVAEQVSFVSMPTIYQRELCIC